MAAGRIGNDFLFTSVSSGRTKNFISQTFRTLWNSSELQLIFFPFILFLKFLINFNLQFISRSKFGIKIGELNREKKVIRPEVMNTRRVELKIRMRNRADHQRRRNGHPNNNNNNNNKIKRWALNFSARHFNIIIIIRLPCIINWYNLIHRIITPWLLALLDYWVTITPELWRRPILVQPFPFHPPVVWCQPPTEDIIKSIESTKLFFWKKK